VYWIITNTESSDIRCQCSAHSESQMESHVLPAAILARRQNCASGYDQQDYVGMFPLTVSADVTTPVLTSVRDRWCKEL
jgi:hypothetical protein